MEFLTNSGSSFSQERETDAGLFGRVVYTHGRAKNITRTCLRYNDSTWSCAIRVILPFGWYAIRPCPFSTQPCPCVIPFWSIFLRFEVGFRIFLNFFGILIRNLIEKY